MPGPTPPDWTHHKPALWADYQVAEQDIVHRLLAQGAPTGAQRARIQDTAHALVASVRESGEAGGLIAPFLQEYGLSNREGVILMCLAEAMLRVPDPLTVDALIEDKVTTAEWEQHLGGSPSGLVNLSTRSLMFTSRVLDLGEGGGLLRAAHDMVRRMGQPLIRTAVREAMKILGHQFVLGRTIGEALEVAAKRSQYRYSFDMLGEAALTQADADRYFKAYSAAINAVGRAGSVDADVIGNNGVSVKLSALHPRLEFAQRDRVLAELTPRLIDLARLAAGHNIGLTVDAEEADRLDLTMDILGRVCAAPDLKGWHGFGFVVQAYQKRAWRLIDLLTDMARGADRRLMLRMVKGAYWDSEIKRCQEQGLADYPVFTRKVNSDVSYIAATGKALSRPDAFYVQVATHNAHSAAAALVLADGKDFEFQRLHGMGEVLHDRLMADHGRPCRIYAPVGAHEDLLPYLVRRLLENGANSSFVNQIEDDAIPVEKIVRDPFAVVEGHTAAANPRIPLPRDLYGNVRVNARGIDLADAQAVDHLYGAMALPAVAGRAAAPILGGRAAEASGGEAVFDPADHARQVGTVRAATPAEIDAALAAATAAAPAWRATPADERAAVLRRVGDVLEEDTAELMALCVREAGKTLGDAIAEVREAVDFCRYYARRAELMDRDHDDLGGGGVFACISPWNFPVAIFTGQIMGALAAGNAVIAKPAEQTPLAAARVVALMHRAGVPGDVLALLPGDGPTVGGPLVADPRVTGVCFTGSTEVARILNRAVAAKADPAAPLIAETGGLNAMIVDSTALPEQTVKDILRSAFQSAGQRCSALRLLVVQEDVADKMLAMLSGAMDELVIGDPANLSTDVGPVIDAEARDRILAHGARLEAQGRLVHKAALPAGLEGGWFVPPAVYALDRVEDLTEEIFGPVLHVVRFKARDLDATVAAINASGYGLTLGIHTRIDATTQRIVQRAHVGNIYVNRNQIGAVVGVQPFGGEGLSGTGPKAGGPHYLLRCADARPAGAGAGSNDASPPPATAGVAPDLSAVRAAQPAWDRRPPTDRVAVLVRAADGIMAKAPGGLDRRATRRMAATLRALAGAYVARHGGARKLPGPTGEDNELTLRGRGLVACLALDTDDPVGLAGHVAAALLAGNGVVLAQPGGDMDVLQGLLDRLAAAGLPAGLARLEPLADRAAALALAAAADIDGLALAGPDDAARALRRVLAARPGAILPLILGTEGPAPRDLYRFGAERCVSINIAAAGGNAELLDAAGREG